MRFTEYVRQQVRQAAGLGVVVAALFISQQQAGVRRARFGGRKPTLGIEQNGAGVRRQHFRHRDFKLAHHLVGDLFESNAFSAGDGFLQTAALVHRGGGDDACLFDSAFMLRTLPSDRLMVSPRCSNLNLRYRAEAVISPAAGNKFERVPHREGSGSSALPGSQTCVPREPNGEIPPRFVAVMVRARG